VALLAVDDLKVIPHKKISESLTTFKLNLDHKTRIDQEVGKVTYVKPRVESAQHG
jgi:hypothetical protein